MWCSACQQDVPLQHASDNSGACCGYCGQTLSADAPRCPKANQAPPIDLPEASLPVRPALSALTDEDWTIEAELRGLERLVGSLKANGLTPDDAFAIHVPHAAPPAWHAPATATVETRKHPAGSNAVPADDLTRPKSHLAAWTILSLGLATFACGGVLLGWSLLGQREDLWPIGMPLALIGQAGLVLGLILQLDGLWHTSRKTAQTLTELDGELERVRQATTLLSTSRTPAGQSFYAHLAQGAAPQLLLADLKGQLDLLAQQMAERR